MSKLIHRASNPKARQSSGGAFKAIEQLESRTLLAGTSIGIYADCPRGGTPGHASETLPNTKGRGVFIVKRPTGSTAQPLAVQYYVRYTSTAVSGQDFQAVSGSVTLPVGKRSVAFNLYPIDDQLDESSETVVMSLKPVSFPVVHRNATLTIADNDEPPLPTSDWWDTSYHYRTSISVNVGSNARTDQPVDQSINFTNVLSGLGKSGSLIEDSIRVIEVSADGKNVLDESVAFQFDKASDYNAASNASGDLVVILKGATAADATRYYHVYFDTTGSFTPASVTPLVSTTDNVTDESYSSVRINTQVADFYYQKAEGGFSSIVDKNGNDWVSWNSNASPGSAGEYRGIPNLGPAGFHPGRDHDVATTIVSQGPIKTVIESTDPNGNKTRWEFYPNFARLTVLSMNQNWYMLYEGTPGGSVNGNDTVVRSDGTSTPITQSWAEGSGLGAGNGEEWTYFRDSGVNGGNGRFMYFVHNQKDSYEDSYFDLDGNMTVFGFGRHNNPGSDPDLLIPGSATPSTFTIGLADGGSDFNSASGTIKGAYKDVSITQGTSEANPA